MNCIIYKDGVEENRIVADEAFCNQYYSGDGYSWEPEPPGPEPEPFPAPPTLEELQAENEALRARVEALEGAGEALAVLLGEVNEDG